MKANVIFFDKKEGRAAAWTDKLSLDLFWIRDRSLTDADALPAPDVLATEIAADLEAALEQFTKIAARLKTKEREGQR